MVTETIDSIGKLEVHSVETIDTTGGMITSTNTNAINYQKICLLQY
jgi:hypothetical protein